MLPTGRGAAMQRFLAAMQEEEEKKSSSGQREELPPPPVRPVGRGRAQMFAETGLEDQMRDVAIARPTGRGRGMQAALGRMMALSESAPALPGVATMEPAAAREPPTEVARPVGRGRSSLMATFLSQQKEQVPGKIQGHVQEEPRTIVHPRLPTPVTSPRSVQEHYEPVTSTKVPESMKQTTPEKPVVRRGTHGQTQDVAVNLIRLDVASGKGVFDYVVEFSPQEDNMSMRTRMINQHLELLGGVKSYNGVRLLLSVELDEVTHYNCTHPESGRPVKMTLICRGHAKERDAADIYNMLFRRIMAHLGLKNMGRKFFDPSGAITVPQHRLEVWPGYVTAVQQFEGGVQLCCDASHRVMRTESVLQLISNLVETSADRYREESLKILLGAVVLTRYNNRVYRVDDISWDKNPLSTFTDSDGREITFYEYYKTNYQIEIVDRHQPLLISRVDRKKNQLGQDVREEVRLICLVPELCFVTGLSDAMRADFRIMKDLTQKLQLTPTQRYEGLCKFLHNVRSNKQAQELLSKWGLNVATLPVRLTARILKQETILLGNTKLDLPPGASSWNVDRNLLETRDIKNWAILHIIKDLKIAQDFEANMRRIGGTMGMKVYSGRLVRVADNRNECFLDALRSTVHPDLDLVVIFFPSLRSDRYAAVKKVCCIERPVSSQVIQSRTLSRPEKARSIIKKIAMQINCKLGGALWGLTIPYEKLMVCGMDVYHGTSGKQKSVMGFVATTNPLQTAWYSRVGFGGTHQELADNLRVCMGGSLKKYHEVSGFYPDRIIMFRDGVGDSQLLMTQEFEVPQLLQAFRDVGMNYKPKLTFVVCQKRILTRIMAVQGGPDHSPRLGNPIPGTVMDHTITRFEWYDFFLVSQSSNRGTVSPTHYIVVYDDGDIRPDHIQRMTYKMTHLYYNWTGTISIPAPAQYAHRLAQLVGQHLHKDPSARLSDKLFFL